MPLVISKPVLVFAVVSQLPESADNVAVPTADYQLQPAVSLRVIEFREGILAFCIAVAEQQKSLNRDWGTTTSDCWRPLLQRWH